jgi:alpha-glucosidase
VNKEATFGIYEDDGETNDYKQGVFELKKITCRSRQDGYVLNFRQTISNGYNPENRDLIYLLHLDECPSSVLIGSLKMKKVKRNFDEVQKTADFKPGWSWNSKAKVCRVEVPAGKTNNGIILKK